MARYFGSYHGLDPHPLVGAIYLGLLISQSTLIGIAAALCSASKLFAWRIIALGTIWLWCVAFLVDIRSLDGVEAILSFIVIGLPTVVIYHGLRMFRQKKSVLLSQSNSNLPLSSDGLRFEIKHVMILTAAVAGAITIGKVVRLMYDNLDPHIPLHEAIGVVVFIVVVSLFYVSIALANVWACFGVSHPVRRVGFVLLMAAYLIGIGFAFFPFEREGKIIFSASTVWQTVIVTLTLLVIRSCGIRLVPEPPVVS